MMRGLAERLLLVDPAGMKVVNVSKEFDLLVSLRRRAGSSKRASAVRALHFHQYLLALLIA